MTIPTKDPTRPIIKDFASEIQERKRPTAVPSKAVINFRNEKRQQHERDIVMVPIKLLRYRKDNGRITSDLLNYEKENGPLDEGSVEGQQKLGEFLANKDPEKTDSLSKSIQHAGQNEPAIITCDGFLINGNRRKMVFEALHKDHPGDEFEVMKVVILPGENDPGGPPTLLEIEKLENRYQLQDEGKAEYYGFDRALSIRRKINVGFSLIDQLRDDPRYAKANQKELDRAEKEYQRDYLWPLECADRYLHQFRRDGMYAEVSGGVADKEGRWQAFIDYSKAYHVSLAQNKWQIENEVPEADIGPIEEAAFSVIRVRSLQGLQKVHQIMRKLPAICANKSARKEFLKIADEVDTTLPEADHFDKEHRALPLQKIDAKWVVRAQPKAIHRVKKALDIIDTAHEKETPLTLLDAALKKLTHESMTIEKVPHGDDLERAKKLIIKIRDRAHELEQSIYKFEKSLRSLLKKK